MEQQKKKPKGKAGKNAQPTETQPGHDTTLPGPSRQVTPQGPGNPSPAPTPQISRPETSSIPSQIIQRTSEISLTSDETNTGQKKKKPKGKDGKNVQPTETQPGHDTTLPGSSKQVTPHGPGNPSPAPTPQISKPATSSVPSQVIQKTSGIAASTSDETNTEQKKRKPKGKARKNAQQTETQPGPDKTLPGPPQQVTPQGPGIRSRAPVPKISKPATSSVPSQVIKKTSGIAASTSDSEKPVSCGHGAERGRQAIGSENYYRASRPESSLQGKKGNVGTPMTLISNYFPITSYTSWAIYQYDVTFSPDEEKIPIRRGLLSNHKQVLGVYIFDGKMLFSNTKYDSNTLDLTSKRKFDDQIVKITVKFVSVIETGDYANIQLFNLLMRNCLRHLELQLVGRNYYDPKAKIHLQRYPVQLWPGYETVIGMFDNGLLLRTEISTKVMREETVLDFLNQCYKNKQNNPEWLTAFKVGVIGTTVLTTYNNLTYRINNVEGTIQSKFKMKDGTETSYIDYYKKKWNITIRNTTQPLLVSKKKKINMGNPDESDVVCLIPELCTMTGLTTNMRDDGQFMKAMADYTRVSPKDRITRYNNFMARLLSSPKSVETLSQWNLKLTNKLVEVPARVFPPQTINSNQKSYDAGEFADWTKHVRMNPMYFSIKLNNWVIISPNQFMNKLGPFMESIRRVSTDMSFMLPRPTLCGINGTNIQSYLSELENVINKLNPSFILCVIQSSRGDLYNVIKRKLCIDRAVPSQVVLIKNIENNNLSVCTKIAIQINSKIGGVPWMVHIPIKNMLIIGFDVCHNTQNKLKSFGAIVAIMNDTQTAYYSCVQEHAVGEEISKYFTSSITKILKAYQCKNHKLPSYIIIYRDGVGDGQLSHVHNTELKETKNVCKNFYEKEGKKVPLAFIIVKKRISTRFFRDTARDGPINPPPGTVVDSVVTDPTMYDFFLVSQNVRMGTVTPTHYNVIEDTLPLWTPDRMQLITYKLTHMYFNWSGTVRVPAPCQLAHKLSFFAAQVLQRSPNPALDELLYFL